MEVIEVVLRRCFEMDQLVKIVAIKEIDYDVTVYGGFPVRFPHWSWGEYCFATKT